MATVGEKVRDHFHDDASRFDAIYEEEKGLVTRFIDNWWRGVVRKRLQEELADSGMTGPAGKRPPFTGLILTIRTAESGRRAGTGAGPLLLLFADVGMLVHCGDPSLVANHTERGDRCGPAGALPTFSSCHAMD